MSSRIYPSKLTHWDRNVANRSNRSKQITMWLLPIHCLYSCPAILQAGLEDCQNVGIDRVHPAATSAQTEKVVSTIRQMPRFRQPIS